MTGIDRHGINQDQARNHFLPAGDRITVLSSRIAGKRISHKSSERRRRKDGEDIINDIDVSEDDEEESLERKLARLRREILEVKSEVENQVAGPNGAVIGDSKAVAGDQEIDHLEQLLDSINQPAGGQDQTATKRLTKLLSSPTTLEAPSLDKAQTGPRNLDNGKPGTFTDAQNDRTDHSLLSVAEFDERLSLLETALGLDALPLPTQDPISAKPLLPALNTLDKQISTLSTSNEVSLDKIKGRVRELSQEAESFERKRNQAKRALEASAPDSIRAGAATTNGETPGADLLNPEQVSKVNALYGTLNTIESLAPILPSVLDRLRSLKDLHSEAAVAGQSLANVEERQADMKHELQGWRDGLEKVEKAMREGRDIMKGNAEVMEEWVRGLEERTKNLG